MSCWSRAACTETLQCDGQIPTAPEQYSLGAALGSWKQILGYLIEDHQERNPGTPIFDTGVFAAPAGLLGSKQGHLAMWRPGRNLNSRGVKFQTKSTSPLKSAWPFPSHPFGFPLIGPQRAGGCRALPAPWPSAGGWGQLIVCMVQLGAILQCSLTRIQAFPVPTQGAKQSRGAICPSVQAVTEPSIAPRSPPSLSHSSFFSCLSFVIPIPRLRIVGTHFLVWPVCFHPKAFLPSLLPLKKSLISRWQTKLDLAVLAQAALSSQLWKSIT